MHTCTGHARTQVSTIGKKKKETIANSIAIKVVMLVVDLVR